MFLTPIQMAALAVAAGKGVASAQDAANTLRRIEEQNKEALKRIEAQNLELQRLASERRRLEEENRELQRRVDTAAENRKLEAEKLERERLERMYAERGWLEEEKLKLQRMTRESRRSEEEKLELQRKSVEQRKATEQNHGIERRIAAKKLPSSPKGLTHYERHQLRVAKADQERRLRAEKMNAREKAKEPATQVKRALKVKTKPRRVTKGYKQIFYY